jgi:cytochrome d ubiquinol oxidase subunit I
MDALTLARLQFGITSIYHFFFVPLTIGLSVLIALMQTLYVASGQDVYKRMAQFWGKLFLINFAMGVVTGIVQEFQFGMNWSEYSRFVGDIFGAPLAIEALLAFFLESTFLGLWIFGWDRLPKKIHLASIWLVALGTNISALWILIANSFMQHPVGFVIRNGRAEMTDFFALILNPNVWVQFPHTVLAGFVTAAFFIMGVSAYRLMRQSDTEMFRRSFQIGATVGMIAIVLVILTGHSQAQYLVEIQPMKIAAAEGLWETENPASFSLFTIGDETNRRDVFAIRIPNLLSLLAYNQLTGEVRGINDLQAEYVQQFGPADYVPPVWVTYWSFRAMVGAGFLLLLLAAYGLFLSMGEMLEKNPPFFKLFPYAIILPYVANTTGWLMTEIGRMPWVVYGLMKLDAAVSPTVTARMLWITLIGFSLVYGVLMAVDVYLLVRYAKGPAGRAGDQPTVTGIPKLVQAD